MSAPNNVPSTILILIFLLINLALAEIITWRRPIIKCGPTGMDISIDSPTIDFKGRMFTKGHGNESHCRTSLPLNGTLSLSLPFNNCGVKRTRTSSPAGVKVTTDVVVSVHPLFLTKFDRIFHLECHYPETQRGVVQALSTNDIEPDEEDDVITELPQCEYQVLDARTKSPIHSAVLGVPVIHRWRCTGKANIHCLEVSECYLKEENTGKKTRVVDEKGCSLHSQLMSDVEYTNALTAQLHAQIFTFGDAALIQYECKSSISMSIGGECFRPQCGGDKSSVGGNFAATTSRNVAATTNFDATRATSAASITTLKPLLRSETLKNSQRQQQHLKDSEANTTPNPWNWATNKKTSLKTSTPVQHRANALEPLERQTPNDNSYGTQERAPNTPEKQILRQPEALMMITPGNHYQQVTSGTASALRSNHRSKAIDGPPGYIPPASFSTRGIPPPAPLRMFSLQKDHEPASVVTQNQVTAGQDTVAQEFAYDASSTEPTRTTTTTTISTVRRRPANRSRNFIDSDSPNKPWRMNSTTSHLYPTPSNSNGAATLAPSRGAGGPGSSPKPTLPPGTSFTGPQSNGPSIDVDSSVLHLREVKDISKDNELTDILEVGAPPLPQLIKSFEFEYDSDETINVNDYVMDRAEYKLQNGMPLETTTQYPPNLHELALTDILRKAPVFVQPNLHKRLDFPTPTAGRRFETRWRRTE